MFCKTNLGIEVRESEGCRLIYWQTVSYLCMWLLWVISVYLFNLEGGTKKETFQDTLDPCSIRINADLNSEIDLKYSPVEKYMYWDTVNLMSIYRHMGIKPGCPDLYLLSMSNFYLLAPRFGAFTSRISLSLFTVIVFLAFLSSSILVLRVLTSSSS